MLPDISGKKSPYKAVEKFSKAVYGTTGGTCSARDFREVIKQIPGALKKWNILHQPDMKRKKYPAKMLKSRFKFCE